MCRRGGRSTEARDAKHDSLVHCLAAAHARASLVGVVGVVVARFIAATIRRPPCGLPLSICPRNARDAASEDQRTQIELGPRFIDVWQIVISIGRSVEAETEIPRLLFLGVIEEIQRLANLHIVSRAKRVFHDVDLVKAGPSNRPTSTRKHFEQPHFFVLGG